jgi:bisphosphoglycerate-independent phosphoglycerate mutase (AlkP superfamily)
MRPKPVVLLILDGFGLREAADDNAIYHANTPTFDRLSQTVPTQHSRHPVKRLACQRAKWATPKLDI